MEVTIQLTIGIIWTKYGIDAPAIGIVEVETGTRCIDQMGGIESLLQLPLGNTPHKALSAMFDPLAAQHAIPLLRRVGEGCLIQYRCFRIGHHRVTLLAIHRAVVAVIANAGDIIDFN